MLSPHPPPEVLAVVQDTTVVTLARDGMAVFTAWALAGLVLAFAALLVVILLVLAELRRLSAAWTDFLAAASVHSQSLIGHANRAARNVEQITSTVRGEVDRLNRSFGGLTDGIEETSDQIRTRLRELLALVALAQSEAEEAVLEAAAGLRALRSNASGILRFARLGRRGPEIDEPAAAGSAGEGSETEDSAAEPAAAGGDSNG